MDRVSRLKGGGYLASIVSVVLLGIPALKSASEHRALLFSLVAGIVLSIAGMILRWSSHGVEQDEKRAQERKLDSVARKTRLPARPHG